MLKTPTERLDRVTHPLKSENSFFSGFGLAIIIGIVIAILIVVGILAVTNGFGSYYNTIQEMTG